MKSFPRFVKRSVLDLCGLWDFEFLGTVDPQKIKPFSVNLKGTVYVPQCYDTLPGIEGRRGAAVYRKIVKVPPGYRSRLEFGGVGMWCAVFVDGEKLAEHFDGYEEFHVEIPASSKISREIRIVVDNQFDEKRNPVQLDFYDWYHHGGILRPAYLHILPETSIDYVKVDVLDWKKGIVDLTVEISDKRLASKNLRISIDGENIYSASAKFAKGISRIKLKVPAPSPWTPDTPNLHLLTVESEADDYIVRFGLRKVEAKGDKILLNGRPLKLLGFCRQEFHSQFGCALPEIQIVQDIQILKDLGCNFVRGSHYPQDQRFLDLCDETGILVWEEYTGWNNREKHYADKVFLEAQLNGVERMIRKSSNHPSVILWGFLNEGCCPPRAPNAAPFYRKIVEKIRKLDKSRLVTAANVYYPETVKGMPIMDVVSYNLYPGWYYGDIENTVKNEIDLWIKNAMKFTGRKLPFIISEIGGSALYGCRDSYGARWTEQYQANLLDKICSEVVSDGRIAGLAIWVFADFRTSERGGIILGRPRGFNNKGVLDEYRRPKLSYSSVKKHFTEKFYK